MKVFENTGKSLGIYSDKNDFRLTATRRAVVDEWNGIRRYYGSKWFIKTYRLRDRRYEPYRFDSIPYIVSKKEEIIDLLSRSVQFKQAYSELKKK